ncbi:hypothetical protein EN912_10400 [Mesorhizobium sp. M7A.F.Ca.CA.004.02.1.1]|nr:hypothetical protein EN912_10400 [Mesorhizobium sp. M7A.F.Ca.CA.004.02.1.1]
MKDALWGDHPDFVTISDEITDNGRWSIHHRWVFQYGGKFYETRYSVGATESQDERPFEYDGEYIECREVRPVEKTVVVYE